MTDQPIDVDGILASLDPALADPGDDPWGRAEPIRPVGDPTPVLKAHARKCHGS